MDKNLLNISAIEDFFRKLLYNNVSKNIYFGNIPQAIQSSWTDFVVVDIASTIKDYDAMGKGVVSILLYSSKNLSNGSKNRSILNTLETKLNDVINKNTDTHYTINRMGGYGDYDSTCKLYYNVVFLNLLVN